MKKIYIVSMLIKGRLQSKFIDQTGTYLLRKISQGREAVLKLLSWMKYRVWTISVLCLWNACSYGNLKKYLLWWKVPVFYKINILFYYLKDLNTTNVNVTIDHLNAIFVVILGENGSSVNIHSVAVYFFFFFEILDL